MDYARGYATIFAWFSHRSTRGTQRGPKGCQGGSKGASLPNASKHIVFIGQSGAGHCGASTKHQFGEAKSRILDRGTSKRGWPHREPSGKRSPALYQDRQNPYSTSCLGKKRARPSAAPKNRAGRPSAALPHIGFLSYIMTAYRDSLS